MNDNNLNLQAEYRPHLIIKEATYESDQSCNDCSFVLCGGAETMAAQLAAYVDRTRFDLSLLVMSSDLGTSLTDISPNPA